MNCEYPHCDCEDDCILEEEFDEFMDEDSLDDYYLSNRMTRSEYDFADRI